MIVKIRDTWYNLAHVAYIQPSKEDRDGEAYVVTFTYVDGFHKLGVTEDEFKLIIDVFNGVSVES